MKKFFSENWPPIALVAGISIVFVWGFSQGRHFEHFRTIGIPVEKGADFVVVDPSTPPSKKVTVADVAIAGMLVTNGAPAIRLRYAIRTNICGVSIWTFDPEMTRQLNAWEGLK